MRLILNLITSDLRKGVVWKDVKSTCIGEVFLVEERLWGGVMLYK